MWLSIKKIGSVNKVMKASMYNILLEDGDSLLLFNSMVGLDSLCRVSKERKHIVMGVLDGTECDQVTQQFLFQEGFLVDDNCDELKKRELLY